MRFDLVDLRLFLHVADAHSITHGARRANLALASASERIQKRCSALPSSFVAVFHCRLLANVSWSTRRIVQQAERMRGDLACYARGLSGGDALSRSRRLRLIDIVDRKFVALPRDSALQRHLAGQERDVSVS
jgi:hypothetical protein